MNGEAWSIADAVALVAAIDAELQRAELESAAKVRTGRQTQAEADYVGQLLRDVRADLAHAFGPFDPVHGCQRPSPTVSWQNKVRWMRRELADREASYPELVRGGRLLEADAKAGLRVLRALVKLYWTKLFQWEPEPGPALDYIKRLREVQPETAELASLRASPGAAAYYAQLRELAAAIEAEQAQQGDLLAA